MSYEVYQLVCEPTGEIYFGICKGSAEKRWWEHQREARRRRRHTKLYGCMRRHGPEAFTLVVVLSCDRLDDAETHERRLIAANRNSHRLLNESEGGKGCRGVVRSEKTKQAISRELKRVYAFKKEMERCQKKPSRRIPRPEGSPPTVSAR